MRIEAKKTVHVSDLSKAKELVLAALRADKCRVTEEQPNSFTAKRGSQTKMRALGGMMVNLKVLPVAVKLTFESTPTGGTVAIHAFDTLGYGTFAGMYDKYAQAVEDIAAVALAGLKPVTTSVSQPKAPKKSVSVQQKSSATTHAFCPTCGTEFTEGALFCSKCGSARAGTHEPISSESAEPQQLAEVIEYSEEVSTEESAAVTAVYKGADGEKSKSGAVVLAIFLGFWTWLYTYGKRDAWKFWTGGCISVFLGIPLLFLYGAGVAVFWAISIWAIIDAAIKPSSYYRDFYKAQLSRTKKPIS